MNLRSYNGSVISVALRCPFPCPVRSILKEIDTITKPVISILAYLESFSQDHIRCFRTRSVIPRDNQLRLPAKVSGYIAVSRLQAALAWGASNVTRMSAGRLAAVTAKRV